MWEGSQRDLCVPWTDQNCYSHACGSHKAQIPVLFRYSKCSKECPSCQASGERDRKKKQLSPSRYKKIGVLPASSFWGLPAWDLWVSLSSLGPLAWCVQEPSRTWACLKIKRTPGCVSTQQSCPSCRSEILCDPGQCFITHQAHWCGGDEGKGNGRPPCLFRRKAAFVGKARRH